MLRLLRIVLPMMGRLRFIKYVLFGILTGLFSFLFINSVTRVIGQVVSGGFTEVSKEYILSFAMIILMFVWIRRALSLAVIKFSQIVFWDLRKQILRTVLNANYQQLAARKTKIYAAVVSDVYVLTDASMSVIAFSTSMIMAIACLIYLFTISPVLFGITLAVAIAGSTVYHFSTVKNVRQFDRARSLENKFVENFNAILNGFKEIYLEPRKGKSIYDNKIKEIAQDTYVNNTRAFTGFIQNQITGQVLFYSLISSVLLYFSITLKIRPGDTVNFVFTLLYLLGSIETIMILLPNIMRARVSSKHLMDLKLELEQSNFRNTLPDQGTTGEPFESIAVEGLEYAYGDDDKSFCIGPVDFRIDKGEVVFIYGGNGSGKTTFIHALLGLCIPSSGELRLNGIKVDDNNYARYRSIFSVVFSDFYLFNDLLWLEEVDMEKWNYYLRLFEIEDKVTLVDKCFSTTDLSTGQRKRLALIAALMEEKPVLILDEWAADQDPHFRKKFYTIILPLLKEKGITVIAVTHDDRYYHVADELYKMDYGKLHKETMTTAHHISSLS